MVSGEKENHPEVIWSPDGSMIAVATPIGAYILDGNTFEEIMVLEKETHIATIEFSSDSTMLALKGSQFNSSRYYYNPWIKIIDIGTQEIIQTFDLGTSDHGTLKFHPNGNYIISSGCTTSPVEGGCNTGEISIWDITTGESLHDLTVDNRWMSQVTFHPNGRYFAASTGSTFWYTPIDIIIWDMYTGTQILKITTYEDEEGIVANESIHFDQTGNVLFVKDSKQLINVYDTRNGDLLETVQVSDEENMTKLFSQYPLGSSIFLREDNDVVQLWNQNGILHSRVSIPENSNSWAISPDLNQLANVTMSDFSVIENGEIIFQQDWQNTYIEASGTLPDGRWVLAGHRKDGNTYLFDALTGEELQSFPIFPDHDTLAISPKGNFIALADGRADRLNDGLVLFDIETGQELFSDPTPIYSLAYSPDPRYLATGGTEGEIRLWDISDPKNATYISLEGHDTTTSHGGTSGIDDLAFSSDGKHLFSGSWSMDDIHIWDVSSNKLLSTIHNSYGLFFIPSPDGKTIIYEDNVDSWHLLFMDISPLVNPTCSDIQAPYILNIERSKSGYTFHPDGQILAFGVNNSSSEPAYIQLWDMEIHWYLTRLEGQTQSTNFLAFSPDGRYLVSNGFDGTTRIWGLPEP